MAGTWRVVGDRLRFEPRFPFEPGVQYRAEFRPARATPIVSTFRIPPRVSAPTTTVVQIYPTADVLPENQLKFYVQFSAPMSRGRVYEHIHLRDANGRDIELPFLELDEELWDPAMTRLTLLIDPGRIKRGVKPLEDIGAVFEQGQSYSLIVAATCEDAASQPLRADYEKKFRIGPADRVPPDPVRWKITAPKADSSDALVVAFDEPMDHALAVRLITVETSARPVAGEARLINGDSRWIFRPAHRWQRGQHRLVVATTVEDLAGNNIGKSFEVDLAAGMQRRLECATVNVAFAVE